MIPFIINVHIQKFCSIKQTVIYTLHKYKIKISNLKYSSNKIFLIKYLFKQFMFIAYDSQNKMRHIHIIVQVTVYLSGE